MKSTTRDLSVGIFLLCCAGSAAAQSAGNSESAVSAATPEPVDSSNSLAEIIVTAQKRGERVQDIPISLTAVSGADLEARGITDTADALREVPGVSLESAGPGQTAYTIRGLSSKGTTAVATVGFYLDDAPLTAPSGSQNGHVTIDPNLYDINRVEVLRGPQGTLYGSGSMGGTIKIVTNQPDATAFAASAKVDASDTAGGGFNRGVNAMINIPIIDGKLAARVVATDEYTSGWIDRIVLANFPLATNPQCPSFTGCTRGNLAGSQVIADHHDVNDERLKGARASIRYQATDDLTFTATAMYQTISQDGLPYFDSPPGTLAHYQPFDIGEPFSDTFRLYNFVGEYNFPALTVTAVTSYWRRNQSQTQDISETIQTASDLPSYYVDEGGVGPASITEIDTTNQFSEELRLTSRGTDRFQWLVGGFFSNFNYGQDQFSFVPGFVPLLGSSDLITLTEAYNIKQRAAFGEASYKITDALKATVGLRQYSYTQTDTTTENGIVVGGVTSYGVGTSNSGLNPKATLSYNFTDDLMVYGTAAKGFRPGSANAPVPLTDLCLANLEALGKTKAPTQYNPDTVWSYELGEKAELFDRRITTNSAVYHEEWNHVQQEIDLSCGFGYTDNVGTASIWGGETEISLRISPQWSLTQSAGYTHARLTGTAPGTGLSPGDELLNVPDYTTDTTLEYRHPFSGYSFIARADNVIVGPSEDLSYIRHTVPSYDIARLRFGLDTDGWSGFLFVDNVANSHVILAYTRNYAENIPSLDRLATNQPRTIGVTFQYRH